MILFPLSSTTSENLEDKGIFSCRICQTELLAAVPPYLFCNVSEVCRCHNFSLSVKRTPFNSKGQFFRPHHHLASQFLSRTKLLRQKSKLSWPTQNHSNYHFSCPCSPRKFWPCMFSDGLRGLTWHWEACRWKSGRSDVRDSSQEAWWHRSMASTIRFPEWSSPMVSSCWVFRIRILLNILEYNS